MENNAYSLTKTKAWLHFSLQFLYCEGKSFFLKFCVKSKKKKKWCKWSCNHIFPKPEAFNKL